MQSVPACHTEGVDGDGGLGEGGLPTCAAQALEFDAVTEGEEPAPFRVFAPLCCARRRRAQRR